MLHVSGYMLTINNLQLTIYNLQLGKKTIFAPYSFNHALAKTLVSILNSTTPGVCLGKFLYPDESRAEEF